ncbi:MAG: GNAT family N-acetyltransferase [Clostridiales bacterium]|nr:GNAT family N-acetyltransferase [Clostridiales bacterium]
MLNLEKANGAIYAEYLYGDKVVGTASMEIYEDDDNDVRIERFDIADAFQGQGHGTRFIHELVSALREEGYDGNIFAAAENEKSARFWSKVGSETTEDPYSYTDIGFGVYMV